MTPDTNGSLPPDTESPGPENVTAPGLEEFDAGRPNAARIYDYLLGGKDNFAADRVVAEKVAQIAPWVISGTRGNRAFLTRAVRYLAAAGVRQFVDIGCGLPASGNVHEIAQAVDPACRVVYVDIDPVVLVHARALLATHRTIAVAGDARDPAGIFADPEVRAHLDWSRPVAVLLVAVLHFIPGDEPARIVAEVRDRLTPGSYLVISHAADLPDTDEHPDRAATTRAAAELYDGLAAPFVLRSREQVTALFDGFDLVQPGVVAAHEWRPDRGRPGPAIPVLAGIGRLPEPGQHRGPRPDRGPRPGLGLPPDRGLPPGPRTRPRPGPGSGQLAVGAVRAGQA